MCSTSTLSEIKQQTQDKRLKERFISPIELLTRQLNFHSNAAALSGSDDEIKSIHALRAKEYQTAIERVSRGGEL